MAACIEAQENAVATMKALGEAAARARNKAKLEESKLTLQARLDVNLKTDILKKAWVFTQVADLMLEADIAENAYNDARAVNYQLQSEADILRSLAKSHRDMSDGGGWGNGAQSGPTHRNREEQPRYERPRPVQPPPALRSTGT